ncbi:hypothetical protein BJX96DRAFT_157705 [Aspergillus floccosus]
MESPSLGHNARNQRGLNQDIDRPPGTPREAKRERQKTIVKRLRTERVSDRPASSVMGWRLSYFNGFPHHQPCLPSGPEGSRGASPRIDSHRPCEQTAGKRPAPCRATPLRTVIGGCQSAFEGTTGRVWWMSGRRCIFSPAVTAREYARRVTRAPNEASGSRTSSAILQPAFLSRR